jgi:hypothetical protein
MREKEREREKEKGKTTINTLVMMGTTGPFEITKINRRVFVNKNIIFTFTFCYLRVGDTGHNLTQ